MTRSMDVTGQMFGRLLVQRRHMDNSKEGKSRWVCLCSCGNESIVVGSNLTRGLVVSCGCYCRDKTIERSTKHNHAHRNWGSRTYASWTSMRSRCNNPSFPKYSRYGGLRVTVCSRWNSFTLFLEDMGERPEGTTLDRKDPWGNYEPDNCRWATPIVQAFNQRRHHLPPDQR